MRRYADPPVLRVVKPRNPHRRPDLVVLPNAPHGVPLTSSLPPPSSEVLSHELDFDDVTPSSAPELSGLNLFDDGEGEDREEAPETRRSWMAGLPPPLPDTEH